MKIKKGTPAIWGANEVRVLQDSFEHDGIELVAIENFTCKTFHCVRVEYLTLPPHKERWRSVYPNGGFGCAFFTKEECDLNRNKPEKRTHYLRSWQDKPGSRWQHESVELDGEDE